MTEDELQPQSVIAQCTGYLASGGLWNPDLADHGAVSGLVTRARDALLALSAKLTEMQNDIGPPGHWVCTTCCFVLMKMMLRASDMAVGVDARPVQDICPNDGASMRQKTWKEDALDSDRVCREQMTRADALETKLTEVQAAHEETMGSHERVFDQMNDECIALRQKLAEVQAERDKREQVLSAIRVELRIKNAQLELGTSLREASPRKVVPACPQCNALFGACRTCGWQRVKEHQAPNAPDCQQWEPIETASKGGGWLSVMLKDGTVVEATWAPFDCWRDRGWNQVEPTYWQRVKGPA